MKKTVITLSVFFITGILWTHLNAETPELRTGEELFREHCAICHPEGGNTVNPLKTLWKVHREANNIKNKEDIIHTMRHPGKGMTEWSAALLPDLVSFLPTFIN